LSASTGSGGVTIRWYDSPTGGTLLYSGTSFTTPSISTTTTYYASSYNQYVVCESASRVGVTATINPLPSAPGSVTGNTRCGSGTLTITATPGSNGNTIRWYSASTGGTPFHTGTSYTTPTLSVNTTYYITSYHTTTGCETATRTPLNITIQPIPSMTVSAVGATRCGAGSVTLTATPPSDANTIRWYTQNYVPGTPLHTGTSFTTPSLSSTTTYYAGSYNSYTGCENNGRLAQEAAQA
jgi:hypothetical protein